jgi:acyl-CoA thioester hydrolase
MKKHSMKVRIYYEDTDCGNVVYYANYLKYMERGRTELMRELGVSFHRFHEKGCLFVVSDLNMKYHASAFYDELIDMETAVTVVTPVTVIFQSNFSSAKGAPLVTGDVRVACVNKQGKLQRMPREIVEVLSEDQTHQ